MDWIHLPQDRDQWCAIVHKMINLRFHTNAGDFSLRNYWVFKTNFAQRSSSVGLLVDWFLFTRRANSHDSA